MSAKLNNLRIMVQLATRNRKEKFLDCLALHARTMSGAYDVFFNISCDIDDIEMNNDETISAIRSIYDKCYISFNANSNKVEAINIGVSDKNFDVLVNTSDDMSPNPDYKWDEEIRAGFETYFPDYNGVLHFNDGSSGEGLNTLCIMGRPYYDRFGYIYHPDYKSFFCDDEFTKVSYKLDKAIYINKPIIIHDNIGVYGSKNYHQYDETYERNKINDQHDSEVFGKRRYKNYYLNEPTGDD